MQITVHKDPVTGLVTHTYIEDMPVTQELSPEEKAKEKKFWEDMLESSRKHNERKKHLQKNFWKLNSSAFEKFYDNTYEEYYKQIQTEDDDKKPEKIEQDFKKSFIEAFIDSLHEDKNKKLLKKNLAKVVESWEKQINPKVLVLMLWQLDFKEQSLTLLETMPCDFDNKHYDYFYDFVKDFRKDSLPLSSREIEALLNEEKTTFLHIQDKYCNYKKINDKLVEKNIKTKHKKI